MGVEEKFHGDKKLPIRSLLAKPEKKFINYVVPRFPKMIEGYHLTLTTILWSAGVIISGYLAKQDLQWLWLASGMLFMQWFSDSLDGALGRYRDTGIPKWGFYMDHFLDYIFMCSILIGYAVLFEDIYRNLIFILVPIFGAFMMNSYLSFAATNEFKITFLGTGPTEVRLWIIIFNTAIIIFGTGFLKAMLPFIPYVAIIFLVIVVHNTQKYIWKIDMKDKEQRQVNQ